MYIYYDVTGEIHGTCSDIGVAGPDFNYIPGSCDKGRVEGGVIIPWVQPFIAAPANNQYDLRAYILDDSLLNQGIRNLGVLEGDVDFYRRKHYALFRSWAYPPQVDFADAWVKDDNDALHRYKNECLLVKVRFPKPL